MSRLICILGLLGAFLVPVHAQPDPATTYAWYRSNGGVLTNSGGFVTNWQNQATAGTPSTRNLAIPGTAPIFLPLAQGTNHAIRFAGTNNIFAAVGSFGALASNRTVVACFKLTGTNGGFLFDGSTHSGMNRAQIRAGAWQVGIQTSPIGNSGNADPVTLASVHGVWQAHFFNFEPVTGGTRITHAMVNGASVTYTNANTNGLGGLILGENASQNLGLSADLGEVLIYDRTLSGAEQLNLAAYLTNKWQIVPWLPPTLLSVAPANGTALGGTLVTLTGSNFAPGLTVKFGGVNAASVIFSNATTATAVTPGNSPGLVNVEVVNADSQSGVVSNAFQFDAAPAPVVTAIAPTNGTTLGGTLVSLSGSNFAAGVTVKFGGVSAASVSFSNATLLTAVTPALSAGPQHVEVRNVDNQSFTATNAFTAVAPPVAPPDVSDVYAWFAGDATLNVSGDNYSVASWSNLGTAATNATFTQAGRNLINLTGQPQKAYLRFTNGAVAGAVRFDGNDGLWAAKGSFGTLTNDRTIIALARISNAVPQGFLFDSTSTSPGYTRALVLSNNWQVSTTIGLGSVTTNATAGTWQIHSFVVGTNSGLIQHFIDGNEVGNASVASPSYLTGLMIGANVSQASGIWADVAEFMVFNSALGAVARANVEAYLGAKWAGVVADTNAPPPPAYLPFVRVFSGGVDGYTCFRIPAIVTTANGTVIAMSDGRIGSCGDIPTPLDLVIKRSFDHGATWGPLQVVTDYGTASGDTDDYPFYGLSNITRVASGDAALLLDRTNSRIWTLYDNGGVSGGRKIKLEMKYSDDDGATWSSRIDVEAQNPGIRPNYGEFLAGPGNGVQLSEGPNAGRLIFPVYSFGSPSASMAIYSDDHGATWQRSVNAVTNGGEIQVAELPGGVLLASMRDNGFSWGGVRTFALSTNGGRNWDLPYTNTVSPPTMADPACQGNIYRLTTTNDSNASRIIHANAASASGRVNMTLRISYDEGQTWPVSNQVYAAGSAYSSVTKLANGDVGLLFEKDPYGSLDYARRSLAEISGGLDSLPAYDIWAGQNFTAAQLSSPAISAPAADADGDGRTNGEEFLAGTDPNSAASFLQLNVAPAAGGTQLSFSAVSNKSYTVQYRDTLNGGTWQGLTNVAALPTNALITLPVSASGDTRFFRLATPQLP